MSTFDESKNLTPSEYQVLLDDVGRLEETERRRRVTRVILAILAVLLVLFIRLLPLDWSNGSFANMLGLSGTGSNGGNSQNNGGAAPGPTSSSGSDFGVNGASNDGLGGGTSYVVGAPGPSGSPGPAGPKGAQGAAGKDGSLVGFANGQANLGTCDDSVNISMRSRWNSSVVAGGAFTISQIRIFNVSNACDGLHLSFDLIDAAGNALLANPIEIENLSVGSTGEILLTYRSYSALSSILSNQVDRVAMEIAS